MRNHGVFALYPLVPVTVSFILGLMAGSLLLPFVALYVWLAPSLVCHCLLVWLPSDIPLVRAWPYLCFSSCLAACQ